MIFVSRRKLLVAAWTGGLAAFGGALAILVLAHGGSIRLPGGLDLPSLVSALIMLILALTAVGWLLGAGLGKVGIPQLAALSMVLFVLALTRTETVEARFFGSMALVGPVLMGWAAGWLGVLRRQSAEGRG